ncbi:heat shock protein 30 [Metarhizium guizhouense ARSEF 977]|uniref:Heat shock protein 30 n=1 Tax=Metarhizium guizhouense (strain ARSEF 977) TaxID=1276136 RepID=A0A0B4H1A4_METGA|nr:heat shock protein 30 [Metarhizium guizhouense ARSEF 977]
MDFIPQSIASNQNFSPLMRFFHDMDKYSRQLTHHYHNHHQDRDGGSHGSRAFFPNFDVRELQNKFELYGELPGAKRNDIKIEFTGPRTLEISGTVKSGYDIPSRESANNTVVKCDRADTQATGEAPSQLDEENAAEDEHQPRRKRSHKNTEDNEVKYWALERSLGGFHRSFTFPKQIQQDTVTASLDSGVLAVTVPKAAEARTAGRVIEVA